MPQLPDMDVTEDAPPPVIRAIWSPLLLVPCVPVFFMAVYNMGPLGELAYPTLAYIGACIWIAPAHLVYGLILKSRKNPRAGLHIASAIALGCLLLLTIYVMMTAFAGGIV